jgi:hypothetical protein
LKFPRFMDHRRAIFRLWTEPYFEQKRHLVEELLSCGDISAAIKEVGNSGFKCGVCNLYCSMISIDFTWVIATCPEKYLLEGETIVCCYCIGDLYRKHEKVLIASRKDKEKHMRLSYDIPYYAYRYIYNPLHNYYMRIGLYPTTKHMCSKYEIIFRMKYPTRNPFFQIDNTLFTILSIIHLNYTN